MIGRLRGSIIDHGADGSCVVDVGGVGYEVFIPLGALGRLGDGAIELHIHTHVREDALVLYGFETAEDRIAFRALLGVSSIGPKLAMSIMGAMNAQELAIAVARADKPRFKGISGVGKKTIERILLDLKDKLPIAGGPVERAASSSPTPTTGPGAAVVGALVQLGYKRPVAERAAEAVVAENEERSLEVLLREALRSFAGGSS